MPTKRRIDQREQLEALFNNEPNFDEPVPGAEASETQVAPEALEAEATQRALAP